MALLNDPGNQKRQALLEVIGGDNESSLEHVDFELDQVVVLVFSWKKIIGL